MRPATAKDAAAARTAQDYLAKQARAVGAVVPRAANKATTTAASIKPRSVAAAAISVTKGLLPHVQGEGAARSSKAARRLVVFGFDQTLAAAPIDPWTDRGSMPAPRRALGVPIDRPRL